MFQASATGNVSALDLPFEGTTGIDFLAGLTGGVVLNAVARATGVVERIGRETSGSYVIGVEPPQGIERNKPLDVTVKLKREGLTVRSPKQVVAPAAGSAKPPKNAKGALGEVLRDPRLAADVGLRVTSYTAQGAEPNKVKTVIVAQVDEPPAEDGANRGAVRTKAKPAPGANKAVVQGALSLAHVGPGLYDVVATVLAGRQPVGAVEREIIIGQER
jgi:hypothetical protein